MKGKPFKNKRAERIYNGELVRRWPPDIRCRTQKKIKMVVEAKALADLKSPPSLHLKPLNGNRKGQHSIRINDQWRVCFYWTDQGAREIEVINYHR